MYVFHEWKMHENLGTVSEWVSYGYKLISFKCDCCIGNCLVLTHNSSNEANAFQDICYIKLLKVFRDSPFPCSFPRSNCALEALNVT